jgi:predicted transcriptional regulator
LEDFSSTTQKNPRAEITHKKYQKQIDLRRNKMRKLLIRGYSRYEISNNLHISQPTVSRDIDFIRNQSSSAAKTKDTAYRYYHEQQNGLDGVKELMKNLWLIIDNPKIEAKEKIKAMNLMLHCYYTRFKLVESEVLVKDFYEQAKKVKSDEDVRIKEQEITRREKALEKALDDHLKNEKLTQEEIDENRSMRSEIEV